MTVQLVPQQRADSAHPINRLPRRRFLLVCVRRSSRAETEDTVRRCWESWQDGKNITAATPHSRGCTGSTNKYIFMMSWCIDGTWGKLRSEVVVFLLIACFYFFFFQFVQDCPAACSCERCLWCCCSLQSLIHKHVHLGVWLWQPQSWLLTTQQLHRSGGWSTLLKGTLTVVNEEVCQIGQRLCFSVRHI